MQTWTQNFNPTGSAILSTAAAIVPIVTLFYLLAVRRIPAWRAAVYALLAAVAVAIFVYRMPANMAVAAISSGVVFGWFRMAWIIVASVFVYDISVAAGQFEVMRRSIASLSADSRMLALLIPFAFGALLEGAGGGGAPVAITGAMLIGLGFPAFEAVVICLVANSAPVAFGGLGGPVRALAAVTGLSESAFSAMIGRILPPIALILPFWIVAILSGARGALRVWPALLVAGLSFSSIQFLSSNWIGPALVDVIAGMGTLLILAVFLGKVWQPTDVGATASATPGAATPDRGQMPSSAEIFKAWSPFILLAVFVIAWGIPAAARTLDYFTWRVPVPGLHLSVIRVPPVTLKPTPEPAVAEFSWLASPGTATFVAGLIAGPLLGLSFRRTLQIFLTTLRNLRLSIVAVLAMLGIGYLIRYCGMDATMGIAMAQTGPLFPFFGAVIGWFGVALSGSDAGSNALFGGLQVITANKLGLSPILMGAANSAGGVMGKMLAAQSLVIGCAATGQQGKEGEVFLAVLKHSLGLLTLVGLVVMLYAYVFPGAAPP